MKVIYIMADTFRRDHLGAYGNDWIHTPNLDKFASSSAVFDNAYIYVNTSAVDTEGFPNTFLQSWSRGIPTISFSHFGITYNDSPVGIVVDSLVDLRNQVYKLINDRNYY